MTNTVDDDTDLTTLVGENGRFKMLVESKFHTEVGNVTWEVAKAFSKEEFLDNYGSNNPGVRNMLVAWVAHYALGDRFEQQPAPGRPQQQPVFSMTFLVKGALQSHEARGNVYKVLQTTFGHYRESEGIRIL